MKRARDKRLARAQAEKKAKAAPLGSPLRESLFAPESVAALRIAYAASAPYPHVSVPDLCDDARARAVFAEARSSLRADYKETDLFKVYQTPDLANLGVGSAAADEAVAAATNDAAAAAADDDDDERLPSTVESALYWDAPQLVALRDALYSQRFRDFVSELSGSGPLEPKADCSVNAYIAGG
jgi:hypothetical protein